MIVAAGLSPAWQTVMRFPALAPGEVNRATSVLRCGSGKVLNVAIALEALGCATRVVTVLGGAAGAAAGAECSARTIDLIAVPTAAETRCCTTLLDDATGRTTELVENAGPVGPDELGAFMAAYRRAAADAVVVVLSGSLPAGTPATLYRDLLAHTPGPAILDARGPELIEALSARPLLVKPNREELARTIGHALDGDEATFTAMDELRVLGAQWVLVTDGARPALVLGPEGAFRVVPPTPEALVNPIGCGDCLAAGIAAGLIEGREVLDALRSGFACATDNCRTILAGRLDRAVVAALEDRVIVERV